jgi:hypothetical protein
MPRLNPALAACLGLAAALTVPTHAAFVLEENFEDVSDWSNSVDLESIDTGAPAGSIGAVGLWSPDGDSDNTIRALSSGNTLAEDGTTGTIFVRFLYNDTDDKATHIAFQNGTGSTFFAGLAGYGVVDLTDPAELDVRDGGSFGSSTPLVSDTWYNLWFVVTNGNTGATKSYDTYLTTGTDSATVANRIADDFAFRDSGGGAINAFSLLIGNSGVGGDVFVDELWIDAGAENLNNPIPEPASLALLGSGMALMLKRRRKSASGGIGRRRW